MAIQCAEAQTSTLAKLAPPHTAAHKLGHQHTFASRLSAAGVSDLSVAQMIGHNSPGILQKYSKAIDEYRRDAVRKLEGMRAEYAIQRHESAKITTVLLQ
jgi:site-specific recombinase XerD